MALAQKKNVMVVVITITLALALLSGQSGELGLALIPHGGLAVEKWRAIPQGLLVQNVHLVRPSSRSASVIPRLTVALSKFSVIAICLMDSPQSLLR